MKKLLVILPAIFPFLAAAPTLPADFSVVFVEAEGFFLSELLVSQTLHFSKFHCRQRPRKTNLVPNEKAKDLGS